MKGLRRECKTLPNEEATPLLDLRCRSGCNKVASSMFGKTARCLQNQGRLGFCNGVVWFPKEISLVEGRVVNR